MIDKLIHLKDISLIRKTKYVLAQFPIICTQAGFKIVLLFRGGLKTENFPSNERWLEGLNLPMFLFKISKVNEIVEEG